MYSLGMAPPTTYPVSLIVDNGCGQDPAEKNITVDPIGVSDVAANEVFTVYPNPASENVQLTMTAEWNKLVLTVFGQRWKSGNK